jgi:hypothetical protein
MSTITYTGELVALTCWCGMRHAVPEELRNFQLRQHENGREVVSIYCPLGHTHVPAGEGEAARLRKQLERTEARRQAERDLREDTERRLAAQKGATTKAKKRHAAGVCPVCKRTFSQMQRHMASQHPGYDPAKT